MKSIFDKPVLVEWVNPKGGGRYRFAYKKGERVEVPLSHHYKIAIGAGLAICYNQEASDKSRELYQKKQSEAFKSYKQALDAMTKNVGMKLQPWVMEELVEIWGADKGSIDSMYRAATTPKRD